MVTRPIPTAVQGDARSAIGDGRGHVVNPNTLTPSSSEIPTEAIQAEVQRQLGGLVEKLQHMEKENARLQDQLDQARAEQLSREVPTAEAVPKDPPPTRAGQWRDPLSALWGDWSGGANTNLPQPEEVTTGIGENAQPIAGSSAGPRDSTSVLLEVRARSMTQLQDMQTKTLQKGLEEDTPEAVKSSATTLPTLVPPEGNSTGIVLQDWLAQIAIAMQDISPSSGTWWSKVMDIVQSTYTKWLGSTPLERLQLQPQGYKPLSEGRWTRVNARACTMLLQCLSEAVKQDLIARRAHSVLIMFRLHTLYQPGGASEKTLVLGNLQTPVAYDSLEDVLAWLRAWPRWVQRCSDLQMMCPDGTVLSKTLTAVTGKYILEMLSFGRSYCGLHSV